LDDIYADHDSKIARGLEGSRRKGLGELTADFQPMCRHGAAAGRKMGTMATQTQSKQSEAKLLVVEDDANILELLSASLR
jgi:hypothetical protein